MLIDVFIYKIIVNNNDDVEIIMYIDNKNCDMYGGGEGNRTPVQKPFL